MAILDLYQKTPPNNSKINKKGRDVEPIGYANAFKPSKDLAKDEKALTKARGGSLNTKSYSTTIKSK
jgi:hypothetical protein